MMLIWTVENETENKLSWLPEAAPVTGGVIAFPMRKICRCKTWRVKLRFTEARMAKLLSMSCLSRTPFG